MAGSTTIRKNLFGFGRKAAPVEAKPRRGRGGLSLSEASRAAVKAGRKSRDLSDFDSWLEARHLETRSDGFVSRVRDSYKRGVEAAEADEQNREFLKAQREQAREAAREKRERPKSKTSVGASAMPTEAAIQAGFKRGLSLSEILAQNPSLRALKKSNPAKFDRCVKAVQAKGGAANAYAVCTAAGTRNPSIFDFEDAARAGADRARELGAKPRMFAPDTIKSQFDIWWVNHGEGQGSKAANYKAYAGAWRAVAGKRNPAAASAEAFKEFHGFEPSEVITVTKKVHYHKHLAAAGELTHLKLWGIDETGHTISKFKGAYLAFNERKNQLFAEGGDQSVNLSDFGITSPHELETLGRLTDIGYHTNKTHLGDEGGEAVYVHKFRTTNDGGKHVVVKIARYPDLIYDVRNEQLLFSGGSYEILREGINK
jgi:hypothetical protein